MHQKPDDPISAEIERLEKPLGGRRALSWLLFLLATAAFLLLPMAGSGHGSVLRGFLEKLPGVSAQVASSEKAMLGQRPDPTISPPASRKTHDDTTAKGDAPAYQSPAPTVLALDAVWNPGPLADAHQPWANDCKVCHSTPFAQVQDKDCKTCHSEIGDHVKSVAGTVHGVNDLRCASCHRDHEGQFALAAQNRNFTAGECAACHRDIKQADPGTKLENVADFADKHPEFMLDIAGPAPESALTKVRMESGKVLTEPTGLKFPHDVHLAAKGIDSPRGLVRMECSNCHLLKPDGLHFEPTTMKEHCASCHTLKLEPEMSNREVPHGSVPAVLTALREFYSFIVERGGIQPSAEPLTRSIGISRPGGGAPLPARSFVNVPGNAKARAEAAARELFEKRSCVICHEVTPTTEPGMPGTPGQDLPQWKITPIQHKHPWMTQSVFNHATHSTEACTDCHKADTSRKATDVLMPGIGVCRDCHAGSKPAANKITSDCGLCHGFHQPARLQVQAKRTQPILIKAAAADPSVPPAVKAQ